MPTSYKGDGMTRYIEAKVICGGFSSGQKIPSLRQLMAKFGISMNTARRGIAALVDKGLLEFHHGSGTFVARQQRCPSPCVIGIVHAIREYNDKNTTFSGLAVLGVEEHSSNGGFQICNHVIAAHEMNDLKLESMTQGCEGLILLGGYDAFLSRPHLGIPAVGLSMHESLGGWFSLVDLDPVRTAELACDFFSQRRRNTVVVIRRERPNFIFREELFVRMWKARHGQIVETVLEKVEEFDSRHGYFYTCGANAIDDARAYSMAKGRRLEEDHTVICIDGKPMFSTPMTPEMPTIAINWRTAGLIAAEECLRRIRNPGSTARRIYIAPELYCR